MSRQLAYTVLPSTAACRRQQRGATLVVGMIMLLLITLIAVAAIRMSTTHVQVVGNERFKTEATTAANYAVDLVLSNKDFTDVKLSQEAVEVNLSAVDTAQSGTVLKATYTDPVCSRYRYIKKSELVKKLQDGAGGYTYTVSEGDVPCFSGQSSTGITIVNQAAAGNIEGNSMCVTTLWDVAATVDDPQTEASATVNQGIEMRMEITDAENKCK